jgi:hypothetical protein
MNRIDCIVIVLALLPLLTAILVRGFVLRVRKTKMAATLGGAEAAAGHDRAVASASHDPVASLARAQATSDSIGRGMERMQSDLNSLYGVRFFAPAALLSFLYLMGFSLGLSGVFDPGYCGRALCWHFEGFKMAYLYNPVYAVLGAYVFHTGVAVRRSFMGDVTKNVYWSSVNRLIFSVGFSLALYMAMGSSSAARITSFAVAFFPGLAVTWLRKAARKAFGSDDSPTRVADNVQELEIQLIQGIDIWKEDRLVEEGIESVQNLATANVFTLAASMHYPMRTIVDWMNQAILIQRFPYQLKSFQDAGIPVSAIQFAWMGAQTNRDEIAVLIANKTGLDKVIVLNAMDDFGQDVVVRVLSRLWQTPDAE